MYLTRSLASEEAESRAEEVEGANKEVEESKEQQWFPQPSQQDSLPLPTGAKGCQQHNTHKAWVLLLRSKQ